MTSGTTKVALAAVTGLLAVGCGSRGASRLSVSARGVAPAAASPSAPLDPGAGIVLERVRIALQRIGLEATAAGGSEATQAMDGAGGDSGDAGEVQVGPFLVDLSGDALATGKLTQAFDAAVPAGIYRELRVVVGPVDPSEVGSTSGLGDLRGSSVVVAGTIDGAAFTFSSSLSSVQRRESTVTVAADGSSGNVTLTIDASGWFEAADGSRLDPRAAASRPAIEAAIAASIDAFGDDDRDGREDGGSGEGAGHP